MAQNNLYLELENGSALPSELEILEGDFFFNTVGANNYGLQGVASSFDRLNILNTAADNDLLIKIFAVDSSKFFRLDFRIVDANNYYRVVWKLGDSDLRVSKIVNGSEVDRVDVDSSTNIGTGDIKYLHVVTSGQDVAVSILSASLENETTVFTHVDTTNQSAKDINIVQASGGIAIGSINYTLDEGVAVNTPPDTVLGADRAVSVGQLVTVDASASTDSDGDTLTYVSTLAVPSGSSATLDNANTVNPSFTPDVAGDYVVSTTSNDGTEDGDTETQTFTATQSTVIAPLNFPQYISGFKRVATKLGKIFDRPSVMPDDREFWFTPFLTENFPNWPSSQYPIIGYSSPDHSEGDAGIYARVFEEGIGMNPADPESWHEWQDVSSRSEFDHISKKTNPIFVYTGRDSQQTETPYIILDGNVLRLYYHNSSVDWSDLDIDPDTQSTMYVTGENPIDFPTSSMQPCNFLYSPWRMEGNGHVGYFRGGKNVITEQPYDYIGVALHGSTKQIVGGSSPTDFKRITTASRFSGVLHDYDEIAWNKVFALEVIHEVKKEGAYYRVLANFKLPTGGTDLGAGAAAELLMDGNFNIVSRPNIFVESGTEETDFDYTDIANYAEITYKGETYGFYNTTQPDDYSAIGVVKIEEVPHNWELNATGGGRQVIVNSVSTLDTIAPDWAFSHTPSAWQQNPYSNITDRYNYTQIVVPSDGSVSTAVHDQAVILSDYQVIDLFFDNIGKGSATPMTLEFGLVDNVTNQTVKLAYRWNPSNGSATASEGDMRIAVLSADDQTYRVTENPFGQASSWKTTGGEAPAAKHMVGFRVIPSENRIIILEGSSQTEEFDITGFDYDATLNLFVSAQLSSADTEDDFVVFEGIRAVSYTDEAIAVPSSPTVTASKTTDSVTLTTSNVSGATGYKYFLDGVEQDNGNFTGLEPDTEYTVYARASNALGDSAPSTISTVRTNEADAIVPTVSASATPTSTTVGGTVTLSATTTNAESILWTCTSGQTATIIDDDSETTGVTLNQVGTHTFRATVTSSEGTTAFAEVQVVSEALPAMVVITSLENTGVVGEVFQLTSEATNYTSMLWECVSGQAVNFTNVNGLNTLVAFLEEGEHILKLTAYSDGGDATATLVVDVQNANETKLTVSLKLNDGQNIPDGSYLTTVMRMDTYVVIEAGMMEWKDGKISFNFNTLPSGTKCEVVLRYSNSDSRGMVEGVAE